MSAEELARKKRVRAGHRGSTTRMLGQVQPTIDSDPLDIPKIRQLTRSLEEKLQALSKFDSDILDLTSEDDIEDEILQEDEVKEQIYQALSQLEGALKPIPAPRARVDPTIADPAGTSGTGPLASTSGTGPPSGTSGTGPLASTSGTGPPSGTSGTGPLASTSGTGPSTGTLGPASSGASHSSLGAKVKLPKISLPRFGGNPVKWIPFWDSYKSAIHVNPDLSEVDKFNYLRSLLDHMAFDAIAGLTLSAANYQEAVEILLKRFGDKKVIISKHMDTLIHMEAISSDRNLRELRRLYDCTESHVRSLKSLGIEAASYGALLAPVLLAKLPPDMRLVVSRRVSHSDLDMDALLATFEEELIARERANPQQSRRSQEKGPHTASTLFSGSKDQPANPQCSYCRQGHSSASCTTVTDIAKCKELIMASGRCFNCLRRSHVSRDCKSSLRCQRCKRKHHTSICEATINQPSSLANSTPTGLNPDATPYQSNTTATLCSDKLQAVFLQTARAVIHNPSTPHVSLEVRLLLDCGSQKSYISERARELLHLDATGEQSLSIATFGSFKGSTKVCPIVGVGMHLKGYPLMSLSLYVVPTICEPLVGQPVIACVKQHPHLLGLELADFSTTKGSLPIDVLIGADWYWELVTGNVCRGVDGPTAIHTKLGWVLSGPSSHNELALCAVNLSITHVLHTGVLPEKPSSLDDQLRAFWELEALGIQDKEKTLYDEFTGVVQFKDGRYQVPLPWREFHDPLPDNYQLSVTRLHGLIRRLRQDEEVLKEYEGIIQGQLENGIIEAIPADEVSAKTVHYLPHHAIVRRDKATTKVRVVYDASAKGSGGVSLNDCLLKGPKFNQLIFDLLVRFRSYQVAITADLEKAFLMVSVEEDDRDVLRFLWVEDVAKEPPDIRMYRFTRVVFGVSSSPFLLNATIKFHLEKYLETNEALVRQLLQSTYVDDIISGSCTEDEAFNLYVESKRIFREGGFNLRKFLTSSRPLQERINRQESPESSSHHEPTYSETTLGVTQVPKVGEHKILGVPWNPESDRLIFDVTCIAKLALDLNPTKRNLVSLIGKFYDPLGYLSPVVIKYKILFQLLCQSKIEWDDIIPDDLMVEWKTLISDLNEATPMSLPRSYLCKGASPETPATLCGRPMPQWSTFAWKSETTLLSISLPPRRELHPYKSRQFLVWSCCQLFSSLSS